MSLLSNSSIRYQRSSMIRLDTISKQNGHHLLFIDASMAMEKGEKVGLVGPKGARKTTIVRMTSRVGQAIRLAIPDTASAHFRSIS
jgi:ATPase subunit of ABC transporter with duplicated ATPase domains